MKLRIGSRGSALAIRQAEWVGQCLSEKVPGLTLSYSRILTTGDKEESVSIQSMGGKGIFVKEIEEALLRKDIDIAVHSLKDVPQQLPPGLMLAPTPMRENPRDVLISRFGEQLNELPRGSRIGSSSPRRQAQIRYKYAKRQYQLEPIRGNIDTRLKKLKAGDFDAIVLAYAGLKRLGLDSEITQVLEPEDILPAPCQGCLGLEIRETDTEIFEFIGRIHDPLSDKAARAERAFLLGLGGNCFVPVGAFTSFSGEELKMKGLLLDPQGQKAVEGHQGGSIDQPELIGAQLAERLLHDGGSEILMDGGPKTK